MREITRLIVGVFITMIIELIVLYIEKVKDKRLWLSLPINLFTNLLLNCSLSLINITWLYIVLLILGEVLVFLIEWGMYQLIQKDNKNWWYSLSANLASFLLGSLFVYLLFLFV